MMRAWIFILIFAGLLLLAPANAYQGGLIEDSPDMGLLLAAVLIGLALVIRPVENGWADIAGSTGCVGWLLTGLLWAFVIAFALWLMAGAPNGGGL